MLNILKNNRTVVLIAGTIGISAIAGIYHKMDNNTTMENELILTSTTSTDKNPNMDIKATAENKRILTTKTSTDKNPNMDIEVTAENKRIFSTTANTDDKNPTMDIQAFTENKNNGANDCGGESKDKAISYDVEPKASSTSTMIQHAAQKRINDDGIPFSAIEYEDSNISYTFLKQNATYQKTEISKPSPHSIDNESQSNISTVKKTTIATTQEGNTPPYVTMSTSEYTTKEDVMKPYRPTPYTPKPYRPKFGNL